MVLFPFSSFPLLNFLISNRPTLLSQQLLTIFPGVCRFQAATFCLVCYFLMNVSDGFKLFYIWLAFLLWISRASEFQNLKLENFSLSLSLSQRIDEFKMQTIFEVKEDQQWTRICKLKFATWIPVGSTLWGTWLITLLIQRYAFDLDVLNQNFYSRIKTLQQSKQT